MRALISTLRTAIAVAALAYSLLSCGLGSSSVSKPTSGTPIVYPTAKPRFAYIADQAAAISGYSVDPSTGVLAPLSGFPIAAGSNPASLVHTPANTFLIMADIAADQLRAYAINATTGALTLTSTVAAGREPRQLAIDPTGRFVYATSQSLNSVSGYALSNTGILTPLPGSPFVTSAAGSQFGSGIVIDPTGKFLYAEDPTSIYGYSINASTGALTLLATVTGPGSSGGLAINSAGTILYAVGTGNGILSYFINTSTGVPTFAASSPMYRSSSGAYSIVLDPTGQFAYTSENSSIVPYHVNGATLSFFGTYYPGATRSLQLTIDPSGRFIYAPVLGYVNVAQGYSITNVGTLLTLPGSPYPTGGQPMSITITSQ